MSGPAVACGSQIMTVMSTNLHFHGMNVTPKCHGDDVVGYSRQSGRSLPLSDQDTVGRAPPGMYWYHQHIHGIRARPSKAATSGAIEVEGIANSSRRCRALPQRFLVVRDQPLPIPQTGAFGEKEAPFWDVSLNYVPDTVSALHGPASFRCRPEQRNSGGWSMPPRTRFWTCSYSMTGEPQPMQIVALDGVPTGIAGRQAPRHDRPRRPDLISHRPVARNSS